MFEGQPPPKRGPNLRAVTKEQGAPFGFQVKIDWEERCTPWSKYMAQSPKGGLIQGLYKPIHGNCAIYFYPGVCIM